MCFIKQASLGEFLRKNLAKKQHLFVYFDDIFIPE